MRQPWRDTFPLAPEIVMLNHASYGLAPHDMLTHCAALRRDVESDPDVNLGDVLQRRLLSVAEQVATELGLDPAMCALTTSATAGAAAVQRSLSLDRGDTVVILDCEYSSVIRGWQRRCDEVGAHLRIVAVPLPLHESAELLDHLSQAVDDSATVLQFSAITSSAALLMPVNDLAAWGRERGATVVVDAAHGPFHIDVSHWQDIDVAFGTLHKWLPVPRSVGILWATAALAPQLRPAETSLAVDEPLLATRLGWPGTFDPASRLAIPAAIDLHREWESVGAIAHCEGLADYAAEVLSGIGAVPTGGTGLRPSRMRAFLLPHPDLAALKQTLLDNNIRAWSGRYDASTCLVRVATHVYNDEEDIDLLARTLRGLISGHRAQLPDRPPSP
jgi:isopenicillin-N epimerase